MSLPPHIKNASDLVTSKESVTQGFINQAKDKVRLASSHVENSRKLRRILESINDPASALKDLGIRENLLSAVGLSAKALGHLSISEREQILSQVLIEVCKEAGEDWKDELVFRCTLTAGDSLGGTSRNLSGVQAKNLFAGAIEDSLKGMNETITISLSKKGGRDIESLMWADRLMVFDKKPDIVDKNIDVIVLENDGTSSTREILARKNNYIACGEVKGGIDPAGADEHWKTANSALDRVRSSFGLQRPALFFAAAAIAPKMALEIVSQLRDNRLTYAANLTNSTQVKDLADWLVSL